MILLMLAIATIYIYLVKQTTIRIRIVSKIVAGMQLNSKVRGLELSLIRREKGNSLVAL